MSKFSPFAILFTLSILFSQVQAAWLVKIEDTEVPTKEFQEYIDFLKASGGAENVTKLLKDPEDLNTVLQSYIDKKVMLIVANKAGYNRRNEKVVRFYNEGKSDFLMQVFLSIQLKMSSIRLTEEDVRATYKRMSSSPNRAFESLNEAERQQLQQLTMVEKSQAAQKVYRKELEKKYKVVRKKLDDFYIAEVESEKIKQTEFNDELDRQLKQMQATKEDLQKRNPKQFDDMKNELRDQFIYRALVKKEMETTKFDATPTGRYALESYYDKGITELFIQDTIISKIEVTDSEKLEEYNRNKQAYEKQNFDKVLDYLQNVIREKKSQKVLANYLSEKKEEMVIKRNREELKKII